jgi:hypothetical protein
MDENRARRITDALRDRGINAHLRKSGIDAYSVQVPAGGGREAIWGAEGTTGLEAEVLLDGDLVGFVPQIPGSDVFDEAQIVDAIARADYDRPEGYERPEAPPPGQPLPHEGGVFRASPTASAKTTASRARVLAKDLVLIAVPDPSRSWPVCGRRAGGGRLYGCV